MAVDIGNTYEKFMNGAYTALVCLEVRRIAIAGRSKAKAIGPSVGEIDLCGALRDAIARPAVAATECPARIPSISLKRRIASSSARVSRSVRITSDSVAATGSNSSVPIADRPASPKCPSAAVCSAMIMPLQDGIRESRKQLISKWHFRSEMCLHRSPAGVACNIVQYTIAQILRVTLEVDRPVLHTKGNFFVLTYTDSGLIVPSKRVRDAPIASRSTPSSLWCATRDKCVTRVAWSKLTVVGYGASIRVDPRRVSVPRIEERSHNRPRR